MDLGIRRKPSVKLASKKSERFAELDFLRGLSILAMVAYHATWNLAYFGFVDWDMGAVLPQSIARMIGGSFLTILGICLSLGASRDLNLWRKHLLRGIKILGWAASISLVTHLFLDGDVFFGVLHVIGVSVMLAPVFLNRPGWAGLIGLVIIALSGPVANIPVASLWLLPLGIGGVTHYMVDYYPMFPWFGVVLIGIWIGSFLYPNAKRRYPALALGSTHSIPGTRFFRFLGRHSLLVYLVHQPLLFGVTYLAASV